MRKNDIEKIKITADHIAQQYGGVIDINTLAKLMEKQPSNIKQDIANKRIKIPYTRLGNSVVTTAYDLAEYLIIEAN